MNPFAFKNIYIVVKLPKIECIVHYNQYTKAIHVNFDRIGVMQYIIVFNHDF